MQEEWSQPRQAAIHSDSMIIEINNREISFGSQRLVFDLYHLDHPQYEKYRARTVGGVFKNVVLVWVLSLETQIEDDRPLFLPYGFDDEWIDCLKATLYGTAK